MDPDTTRNKLADDLSGTLPPSCRHMEREEYRDCVLQMLEDLEQLGRRDGCIAAAWALDALPSLQRELAEARRELLLAREGCKLAVENMGSEDSDSIAMTISTLQEILSGAPGPSDANGEGESGRSRARGKFILDIAEMLKLELATCEATGSLCQSIKKAITALKSRPSLTPLTDESVRGVLVDDGEPRVPGRDEQFLSLMSQDRILYTGVGLRDGQARQCVKLRPASEFGVPGEPLPVQVHRKLEAIAESLGVKDWQAAGTSTLATLIQEQVGQMVHEYRQMRDGLQAAKNGQKHTRSMFAKTVRALADALGKSEGFDESRIATIAIGLIQMVQELVAKSTPAEPAQKLVKLPEDVEVWGWIVRKPLKGERYRMPQHGPEEYVANDDFDNNEWPTWTKLDHALYGVDVERARLGLRIQALEASRDHALHAIAEAMAWTEAKNRSIENAVSNLLQWFDLCKAAHNAALKDVGERVMELEVAVERLRKAIRDALDYGVEGLANGVLEAPLSPSPAAAIVSTVTKQVPPIPFVPDDELPSAPEAESEGGDSQER